MSTKTAVFDVEAIRLQFPILAANPDLAFLDSAASSQKPAAVLEAMDRFYRTSYANVHRGVHRLSQEATGAYEGARSTVARFIGAAEQEVVFTKGCTEAVNLVASSWGRANLKSGDLILVGQAEHHSNIVPWQLAAERAGARLIPVPVDDAGRIDLDAYEVLLGQGPKAVAVQHVSNALGAVNPIAEIVDLAHQAGAIVLVDGAQAVPHFPVDVKAIGADYYVFSPHKVFGPTGIGVLYGKHAALDALPPYQGGGSMIRSVTFEKTTYADVPTRFEAGTPPIAEAVGLAAAIEWVWQLDRAVVAEHQHRLFRDMWRVLSQVKGVRLHGSPERNAGIVSFTMDCAHPHDIGTILDKQGVAVRVGHHCCQPLMKRLGVPATVRASLCPGNTWADVEALIRGVNRVKEVFA